MRNEARLWVQSSGQIIVEFE